ncbi:class I SAM-dependent methyltransferase [Asticcacaulis endophyticus]|uniref:SAM-dependent methyltransferase n=1 Tax=Asticcacaulis endophyticus TaxID=1395890 RepID=A0A918UVP6_9CAUL|nr:SAM-dependent methyltransferase [Asticcacaulis endophyticus]GGZ36513.1 SAM-dependent methyltransferase [Asticcacaulis endophyticus]
MSLKDRLKRDIAQDGPMTIADYMWRCLLDPKDGYYSTRPALGADGDFITAPMISQIFGELIGLWCVQVWQDLGAPERFNLVEIGPGDGTLISDILRAGRVIPDFLTAAQVVLVEPSLPLRALQLAKVPYAVFLNDISDIPVDAPLIIIANEILDCLPARQFIRRDDKWHERRVGLSDNGELIFGLSDAPSDFIPPPNGEEGQIYEISPAQRLMAQILSDKLKAATGAALLIDYGRDAPGSGDTLQALYRQQKFNPLEAPGAHDLTVWADFPSVAATARTAGVAVSEISTQSAFLQRLGIVARLEALSAKNPDRADLLARQIERLIAPDQMGELFKVLALSFPPDLALPALEPITPRA